MSILTQDIDVWDDVASQQFFKEYDPQGPGYSCVGVLRNDDDRCERSNMYLNLGDWSLVSGVLRCESQGRRAVIYNEIDWDRYNITELQAHMLLFRYGHALPKRIDCPWGPNWGYNSRVSNYTNTFRLEDTYIRARNIVFFGLFVGNPERRGLYNCEFDCESLMFHDIPAHIDIRGKATEILFLMSDLYDIESYFSCHVIPQTCGPKKVSTLKHVRALYNNDKKYQRYWPKAEGLYDAEGLVHEMGLDKIDCEHIILMDNLVRMRLRKIAGKWICINIEKR
jgi:hypothetical protein